MIPSLKFDQTAPLVSAFDRNMRLGRWEAGVQNLQDIRQLIGAPNGEEETPPTEEGNAEDDD